MSIWDCEKPLDAMMLSHDHIAMLAVKHERQIKDIAAHLLELKQRVTPMMEFKRREWVGMTGPEVDEAYKSVSDRDWAIGGLADARVFFCAIEAKLKEKNGG